MKYIYESPDKGQTIYRRPINDQDVERELIQSPLFHQGHKELEVVISNDGVVVINDFEKRGQHGTQRN